MLENYTENLVREVLSEYKKINTISECEDCEDDIVRLVLNEMPPKYFLSNSNPGVKKAYILNRDLRMKALIKITEAVSEIRQKAV